MGGAGRVVVCVLGLLVLVTACSSGTTRSAVSGSVKPRPEARPEACPYLTDAEAQLVLGADAKPDPEQSAYECFFQLPTTKTVRSPGVTETYQPHLIVQVIPEHLHDLSEPGRNAQPIAGFPSPATWTGPAPTVTHTPRCKPHRPCTRSSTVSTPGGELLVRLPGNALAVSVAGTSNDLAAATAVARMVVPRLHTASR